MNLFNKKTLENYRRGIEAIPPHHLSIIEPWANSINTGAIQGQGEVALHGDFKARIIEDVLGYTRFGVEERWSCSAEKQMGRGPVDLALGDFGALVELLEKLFVDSNRLLILLF